MELIINKNLQLKTIQDEFQAHYPYLKIEFYEKPHREGEGTQTKNTIKPEVTLGMLPGFKKEGQLRVRGTMTVAELENSFCQFGLNAQVFRKSGELWLQTIQTDNWTLIQQLEAAIDMAEENSGQVPEDYHEQE